MRNIATVILLFSMVIYIGGYHLVYAWHQAGLKEEMKAYLKCNKQANYGTKFSFMTCNGAIEDPKFEWEEEEAEFRYDNEWYDVVYLDKKDGVVQICCLKDNSENELEKQLDEIHKAQKSPSSTKALSHLKYFPGFYFKESFEQPIAYNEIAVLNPHSKSFLPRNIAEIHKPPPRC